MRNSLHACYLAIVTRDASTFDTPSSPKFQDILTIVYLSPVSPRGRLFTCVHTPLALTHTPWGDPPVEAQRPDHLLTHHIVPQVAHQDQNESVRGGRQQNFHATHRPFMLMAPIPNCIFGEEELDWSHQCRQMRDIL